MIREATLFTNGRNQSVRIPRDLEFPGTEITIEPQPDGSLVLRPKQDLLSVIQGLAPLPEADWPDPIEELPVEDVSL